MGEWVFIQKPYHRQIASFMRNQGTQGQPVSCTVFQKEFFQLPCLPLSCPIPIPIPHPTSFAFSPRKNWLIEKLYLGFFFPIRKNKTVLTKNFGHLPTHTEPLRGLGRSSTHWTWSRDARSVSTVPFSTQN